LTHPLNGWAAAIAAHAPGWSHSQARAVSWERLAPAWRVTEMAKLQGDPALGRYHSRYCNPPTIKSTASGSVHVAWFFFDTTSSRLGNRIDRTASTVTRAF
jgi:hypothetical protein